MSALPKVKAVLDALPPKKLELCAGKPTMVVEATEGRLELGTRLQRVVGRIRSAKFTGKADEEKVPDLFRDYVQRITHALQQAMVVQRLGAAALDEATVVSDAELSVTAPPAAPLRLTTGQLLLVVADVAVRRDEVVRRRLVEVALHPRIAEKVAELVLELAPARHAQLRRRRGEEACDVEDGMLIPRG